MVLMMVLLAGRETFEAAFLREFETDLDASLPSVGFAALLACSDESRRLVGTTLEAIEDL